MGHLNRSVRYLNSFVVYRCLSWVGSYSPVELWCRCRGFELNSVSGFILKVRAKLLRYNCLINIKPVVVSLFLTNITIQF